MEANTQTSDEQSKENELPQCKIKRNYSCNHCSYFTQNPRFHLSHLRDIHGERIVINKCNLCLYASRHHQKLIRHMKMVHGSTEGITPPSRKRATDDDLKWTEMQKRSPTPPLPPLPSFSIEEEYQSIKLYDARKQLEMSRNAIRDLAVLYFAQDEIGDIMAEMEKSDNALLSVIDEESSKESNEPCFEEESLICNCNHVSKCFADLVIHRKLCSSMQGDLHTKSTSHHDFSIRCEQCGHLCKSSEDLLRHLKSCLPDKSFNDNGENKIEDQIGEPYLAPFTNNIEEYLKEQLSFLESSHEANFANEDCATNNQALGESSQGALMEEPKPKDEIIDPSLRKVFKCPRCPFWASTASRFHVHIVGHLNRKPFECSLCAYRSNWQWDITKHIRLKTLKSPRHANARVLMNDEIGRRNYSKYNKYITLMKITDDNGGDKKQMKTGEMTPNQEASLAVPSDFSGGELSDTELNTSTTELSVEQKNHQEENDVKQKKPMVPRFSDDLVVEFRSMGLEKKAFYSCRKCQYKHSSRDAVLAHVKYHYPNSCSPPLNLTQVSMSEQLATAMCLSQTNEKNSNHENISIKTQGQKLGGDESSVFPKVTSSEEASKFDRKLKSEEMISKVPSKVTSLLAAASKPSGVMPSVSGAADNSAVAEHNEKKKPSPFRCGHCHQVSNWKHVIQRHCRLKHSNNIQIEGLDRSSDILPAVYRRLEIAGDGISRYCDQSKNNHKLLEVFSGKSNSSHQKKQNKSKALDEECVFATEDSTPKPVSLEHKSKLDSKASPQSSEQFNMSKNKNESMKTVQFSDYSGAYNTSNIIDLTSKIVSASVPKKQEKSAIFLNLEKKSYLDGFSDTTRITRDFSVKEEAVKTNRLKTSENELVGNAEKDDGVAFKETKPITLPKTEGQKETKEIKLVSVKESIIVEHKSPESDHTAIKRQNRMPKQTSLNDCLSMGKISKDDFIEHTRQSLESINKSKQKVGLIKPAKSSMDVQKDGNIKDEQVKPIRRIVKLKNITKPQSKEESEKDTTPSLRRSRRTSENKCDKTPASKTNTIMVNPRTGQIIRRN